MLQNAHTRTRVVFVSRLCLLVYYSVVCSVHCMRAFLRLMPHFCMPTQRFLHTYTRIQCSLPSLPSPPPSLPSQLYSASIDGPTILRLPPHPTTPTIHSIRRPYGEEGKNEGAIQREGERREKEENLVLSAMVPWESSVEGEGVHHVPT